MTREEFIKKYKNDCRYYFDGYYSDCIDDFLTNIYNDHEAQLKAKDERIKELEEAMKPKSCDGCSQSWKPNTQTFHKYFCEYLQIPIHGDFCCNRYETKQVVVIEKWLCKNITWGTYFVLEASKEHLEARKIMSKVKLLDTYEVEL